MNAPAPAQRDDREPDARPRTDAVVKEQARRRVRAEADVQGMPERELAGESHHHVPGLPDVREVERQRHDGEDVAARDERQRERGTATRRDQRAAPALPGAPRLPAINVIAGPLP